MNRKILLFVSAGVIIVGLSIGAYFLFMVPRCPKSCDDGNTCTQDTCSAGTDYECFNSPISGCCGNTICETEEGYETCSLDCPKCDDNNECTNDSFNYHTQKCSNAPILDKICCGNTICETGENYKNCARDCPNCDDNNKCTLDSYDYHQQKCINKTAVPCCGNGTCDKGAETRLNCSTDCPSCDDNSRLTADSFNYVTQKCEHIVTHYIFDDFENGAGEWEFFGKEENEPVSTNWSIVKDGTNTVLRGAGHNWAGILGKSWPDYIFKTRFKIVKEGDGIHFNFRNIMGERNPTRYFIWVGSNGVNLAKQINEKFFSSLAQPENFPGFGKDFVNVWHTLEIRGYGNIINIYVDNKLLIKYKDTESPVLSGGIAFETLNNSEFLIDDVEVKAISEKNIIYP